MANHGAYRTGSFDEVKQGTTKWILLYFGGKQSFFEKREFSGPFREVVG